MLDIKFIRENPDLIRDAARKKRITFNVEKLLEVDKIRRERQIEIDALRAQLHATSDQIAQLEDKDAKERIIAEMRALKKDIGEKEKAYTEIMSDFERLMYEVPNIPDPSVPDGGSDADNQEIRTVGVKPEFSFEPKSNIDILHELDLADFERGALVGGFRGFFLKNDAVLLTMGIWQFVFKHLVEKGYQPHTAPVLVREESFLGTGYFPQGREDVYKTQDDTYLIGTSEVSIMGMFRDQIFDEKDLPIKIVAFSPCFRREIGAHGKDTKGLYRVHEFMKVEQIILGPADHMESVKFHEELQKNGEEIMQLLGLAYRVVVNCGGDLGLGQVKKYDIEAWLPARRAYGETHSTSYFHDFQTRRLGIKYRNSEGVVRFAHSLNATAIATPRILMSILEQNQQEDGSVKIPKVLVPYVGKTEIKKP